MDCSKNSTASYRQSTDPEAIENRRRFWEQLEKEKQEKLKAEQNKE